MTRILEYRSKNLLLVTMIVLTAILGVFALPTSVGAAPASAKLRAAHLAPTVGNVDIYLNDGLALANVPYSTVSNYLTVPSGDNNIKVFGAGANPTTTSPALNADIFSPANTYYTLAVLSGTSGPKGLYYEDDITNPAVTRAKVRVVHASPDAGPVDIAVQGGPVLWSQLKFGDYTLPWEIPAGSYNLEIRRAGTSTVLFTVPTLNLAVGTVYTVVAQGLVSGTPAFTPRLLTDATFARVRVAHLSPGTPQVDVYVGDKKVLSKVSFGTISQYLSLPTGTYRFRVFLSSANGQGAPAIDATATVATGKDYTVAALGITSQITAGVYVDDNTRPAEGRSRLRVIHASPDAPAVDIAVQNGGPVLVSNIKFKDASGYLDIPSGKYKLEVRVAGTNTVAYKIPTLTLQGGQVYSAIAQGLLGGTPAFKVALKTDESFFGIGG